MENLPLCSRCHEDFVYEINVYGVGLCQRCLENDFQRNPHILNRKVTRNERCPCGSGKKYKVCCRRKAMGLTSNRG